MMRNRSRAVALIEILALAAVIGVLAAVAIPNFLEAQARSDISRVRADMRVLGAAVEAYRLDWVVPPYGEYVYSGCPGWHLSKGVPRYSLSALRRLTTPTAYVQSIPRDAFGGGLKWKASPYTNHYYPYNSVTCAYSPQFATLSAKGYAWHIASYGPSGKSLSTQSALAGLTSSAVYDPTNGTLSLGLLIRTNKGEYPEKGG
ncbi:MAG: type II secretion system protein [Candidatus Sumerlaeota bacterium]|nr:type II secretion system protein [Candidatus Sumerlaeota bacterium]